MRTGLYWLTQDLRLRDNSLWQAAAGCDRLICVYTLDERWSQGGRYQCRPMGAKRRSFVLDCLRDLDDSLGALGQSILLVQAPAEQAIAQLVTEFEVDTLFVSQPIATDETRRLQRVAEYCPGLSIHSEHTHTLWRRQNLPFELEQLPATFSQFRKQVESLPIGDVCAPPNRLPAPPEGLPVTGEWPGCENLIVRGGERAGREHLRDYLWGDKIRTYKQVRNRLDGWDNSSKLSFWLSHGCLSARDVAHAVGEYERHRGANESTYWLFFELLWREYFQWYAMLHGVGLFRLRGLKPSAPLLSFYPQRFRHWSEGSTPYALVNAAMKQLNQTGYLSNRARQIVASALVNELGVDWRYGAAYFQQQLIDYDVASNWGNWQYIAGVGADPRGGRHFNLEKQTNIFDPDRSYIARWGGESVSAMDSVDAADWPIPS